MLLQNSTGSEEALIPRRFTRDTAHTATIKFPAASNAGTLLEGLKAETLILTSGLTDVCVHYTFADAHQSYF